MSIYESIAAIMAEGYSISKEKKNLQQGFLPCLIRLRQFLQDRLNDTFTH